MSQRPDTAPAVVDALGKTCPLPVIELARAITTVEVGTEIVVLADDPGARLDIPIWCRMKSHQFVGMDDAEVGWRFRVRRTA